MNRAALALALLAAAPAARAQTQAPTPAQTQPAQFEARDVAAAAAAYQQAQQAQLVRDYARAAELFELADRAAPSPPALRSAIRNHQAAGRRARAATLALVARDRDAADPQSAQLAASVLAELAPQLASVRVRCAPACDLTVDGGSVGPARATAYTLFVDPGAHSLDASFEGRPALRREFTAAVGAATTIVGWTKKPWSLSVLPPTTSL